MGFDYHQIEWGYLALAVLSGYLLGSIPFGLLFTRLLGLGDIRGIGSGNIGATNVLRTGRKGVAAATLLADMLKGTMAVVLAKMLSGPMSTALVQQGTAEAVASAGSDAALSSPLLPLLAGFAAFIGHLYPVWLKFKGGKGVATYIGVLLGLAWPYALLFAAIWLATAFVSRISSLSALVASAAMPLAAAISSNRSALLLLLVMTTLVFWKHRDNINRLLRGEESRIGGSKGH